MTPTLHVIGAGLAGLAAATRAAQSPARRVIVWEATQRAGGRCWSFHDATLGRTIDNGNHLILSGNDAVLSYAARIGARDRLEIGAKAALPFVDLENGRRWTVRVPRGPMEALRGVGIPGLGLGFANDLRRLLRAGPDISVGEAVRGRGRAWTGFREPLTLAVCNAPPDRAAAPLLATVLRRTVLRGADACRPVTAPDGLGHALIAPAERMLAAQGAELRFGHRLAGIDRGGGRATALRFAGEAAVPLGPHDAVILAVPPAPYGLGSDPGPGGTILNAHFVVPPEIAARLPPILGVLSGAAHWVFRRGDTLSVTVSAAEDTLPAPRDRRAILDRLWNDVARIADCPGTARRADRLIRERAATAAQSPAALARRPASATPLANLTLAGDHVASPLPASIEAAVESGTTAAARLDPT